MNETTHVGAVIEGPVLRNGYDRRLVVGRGVDRADAVGTCWNTCGDVHAEDTIHGGIIDTLYKAVSRADNGNWEQTLKKVNLVGSFGVVWVRDVKGSMT